MQPKQEGKGYQRVEQPIIHFANCDTGAMVTCISSGTLEVFPEFKAYFTADPDIVFGLADNPTEI
jgi:hypothetical protein